MPLQKKNRKLGKDTSRCRKECLKKYMKPNLRNYQGKTFGEKIDYCISSYYVCCKPEPDNDQADRQDIREECRERIKKMKGGEFSDA